MNRHLPINTLIDKQFAALSNIYMKNTKLLLKQQLKKYKHYTKASSSYQTVQQQMK